MSTCRAVAAMLLAGVARGAPNVVAQQPTRPPRVTIGFGVDTAGSPNREIFTLYQAYLAHRLDSLRPNPYWSRAEQAKWPLFDLLSGFIYQGFPNFTVLHLAPAVGLDSTYLIRTLVFTVGDSGRSVSPLALYRVYAVREAGQWVLANALPRVTRSWRQQTLGRVTFIYPPSLTFDRRRAAASAAFVDSLARAFGVPPPGAIAYYFTKDLLETFRATGLDYFPLGADTIGGRANPADALVLVAASSGGEGYRHELAHIVLAPLFANTRPVGLVLEGLMTWTGGSAGLRFRQLLPGLDGYLRAHPQLTLENLMADPPPREGTLDVGYDGLAALCAMVHEKGGVAAVREFVTAGPRPPDAEAAAARLLGVPPEGLDALWRAWVAGASGPARQ